MARIALLSESALYKLILRSDKPDAKAFQDWVIRDVLPAIRKDGIYVAGKEKGTAPISALGGRQSVAVDVCKALTISNSRRATMALDAGEMSAHRLNTQSGSPRTILSERRLYKLVLRSPSSPGPCDNRRSRLHVVTIASAVHQRGAQP